MFQSITGDTIQPEAIYSGGSNTTLLDLGYQPLVNNLCKTKEEALSAEKYRLRATIDDDLIIKLDTEIPAHKLYENYLYHSGVNKPFVNHCRLLWHKINHLKHDTIIDIGGNDGTLLKAFQSQTKDKLNLFNVDASVSFREQNTNAGITYIQGYFSKTLSLPKADLIISTNVFQHTSDVIKFVEGIQKHLDGVWILEFPYTLNTMKTLQFDQFYHEHYYYWLVTPLDKLFKKYGLNIFHAEELPIHGGTMRLWITNKKQYASTDAHLSFIKKEKDFNFKKWSSQINSKILTDRIFLANLKGKTAYFGAAAKGCVYLNILNINIDNNPNSYVVDDTEAKQGLYIPGTGMRVMKRSYFYEDQPDNLVILAHNYKDYLIKNLRDDYKGRIITMLPTRDINMYDDNRIFH
jgi:hypothetical protein